MVKPNVKVSAKGKVVKAKPKLNDEQLLQNTANRWATKYGFVGDLTIVSKNPTGSYNLAVNGQPLTTKYVNTGSVLISGKAIARAQFFKGKN
jgi:hypothetical protein